MAAYIPSQTVHGYAESLQKADTFHLRRVNPRNYRQFSPEEAREIVTAALDNPSIRIFVMEWPHIDQNNIGHFEHLFETHTSIQEFSIPHTPDPPTNWIDRLIRALSRNPNACLQCLKLSHVGSPAALAALIGHMAATLCIVEIGETLNSQRHISEPAGIKLGAVLQECVHLEQLFLAVNVATTTAVFDRLFRSTPTRTPLRQLQLAVRAREGTQEQMIRLMQTIHAHLTDNPPLEEISLLSFDLAPELRPLVYLSTAFGGLTSNTNLRKVRLEGLSLGAFRSSPSGPNHSIECLEMDFCTVQRSGLRLIDEWMGLKRLQMVTCVHNDNEMRFLQRPLSHSSLLEHLSIRGTAWPHDRVLLSLASVRSLQSLELGQVGDLLERVIRAAQTHERLQSLTLADGAAGPVELVSLTDLLRFNSNVRSLSFINVDCERDFVIGLANGIRENRLDEVALTNCQLRTGSIPELGEAAAERSSGEIFLRLINNRDPEQRVQEPHGLAVDAFRRRMRHRTAQARAQRGVGGPAGEPPRAVLPNVWPMGLDAAQVGPEVRGRIGEQAGGDRRPEDAPWPAPPANGPIDPQLRPGEVGRQAEEMPAGWENPNVAWQRLQGLGAPDDGAQRAFAEIRQAMEDFAIHLGGMHPFLGQPIGEDIQPLFMVDPPLPRGQAGLNFRLGLDDSRISSIGREDVISFFRSIASAHNLVDLQADFTIDGFELVEAVLDAAQRNEGLRNLSGLRVSHWLEEAFNIKLGFYLKLNRHGRKLLATQDVGFWPMVLERADADVIFRFLQIKPELVGVAQAERKRPVESETDNT